ncbi:MAG: HAD family phosphatase [Pseudomonadota bacterium]
MTIKAILFDMDGVLIEAKEWHYEALNKALDHFNMPISRQDHLEVFNGLPTRKKLEMLTRDYGLLPENHDLINKLKQQYTLEIIHRECRPLVIHETALNDLKSRGYKLAVCSNSVRNTVEIMMHKSALAQYLDYMVSNEDVINGKPHPEMYLKAMHYFNVQPHECLVVEDNENGIKAARAAGAHVMIVKEVDEVTIENILAYITKIETTT